MNDSVKTTGEVKFLWPDHAAMVRALAKHMPGNCGSLMHAAIGLSGEVGELIAASDRGNIIEECGDMEFYLEFAYQSINVPPPIRTLNEDRVFSLILTALTVATAGLLDAAKKCWVYEKDIDLLKVVGILNDIASDLSDLYSFIGVSEGEVKGRNMRKLAARYHEGKYSNAQAQQRADKAHEEQQARAHKEDNHDD